MVDAFVVVSALAAGAAVLGVTWFADRIGGSAGGLLATAPVTTAAAILYLSFQGDTDIGGRILSGGASLFAAIVPMPAYFYVLKWSDRWHLGLRLGAGISLYLGVFTGITLLASQFASPRADRVWFVAVCLLVVLFWFTFMRVRIDAKYLRGGRPTLRWPEALLRFASGMAIIFLVDFVAQLQPDLAAAWAIFPGVFVVSLLVFGIGRGAAFSARAAQAASLGGIPLALFLLTFWFCLPIFTGQWAPLLAMIPAWGAYFGALVPLYRVRKAAYDY